MENHNHDNQVDIDLTSFLEEVGLTNLTEEQKAEYSEQILELLEARIQIKLMEALSDEDLEYLESASAEDADKFLAEKGINVDELSIQAGQEIREEVLQSMAYAQGIIDTKKGEADSESAQ